MANELETSGLDRKPDSSLLKIPDPALKSISEEYRDANISRNQSLRELKSSLFSLKVTI